MWIRRTTLVVGAGIVVVFGAMRPDAPSPGSDCEVLSSGFLREPVTALAALAIVLAGWIAAAHRPVAGSTVMLAGWASIAAHATAHPGARALDGLTAALALIAIVWSIASDPPSRTRLIVGAGVFVAGLFVWVLTRSDGVLCDATGPWGHAGWHLLASFAVLIVSRPKANPSTLL
jgi:hypothetical protein